MQRFFRAGFSEYITNYFLTGTNVFLQVYFGMLDALLAAEELPEEYRDRCQVRIKHTMQSTNKISH